MFGFRYWNNAPLREATIKVQQADVCRIRSYVPLKGKGLVEAKGASPNLFFAQAKIPRFANDELACKKATDVRKVFEYDVNMRANETITVVAE